MALNQQQKAAFERQIMRMKEDGLFMPAQRSLSGNTRYLIISYGGTGAAALFGVKKHFEDIIPKDQLDDRVRFLAIDTDGATQQCTKTITQPDGTDVVVPLDALTNDQFVQLSGSSARLFMNDASVAKWINPKLLNKINQNPNMLNNDGASGIRQLGRLTLYPSVTSDAVRSRVTKLVGDLTHNNAYPLRVFILSGIAGGTGSGTVVDMTYLIRNVLEEMPGNVDSPLPNAVTRSRYCGFLLLPPTGDSNDVVKVQRGNRNGYAALKEINHFMTLKSRNGQYAMTFSNGTTVKSIKNIFDVCYLLDGTSDGVAFRNPREQAVKVLAESILDMVCASQVTAGGAVIQTVDSFMNDRATNTANMVAGKSVNHAMRDADYLYCALGHSEFAMPIHEIKAYVAKQMFDKIYALFLKCENVEDDDAKDFLREVMHKGIGSKHQAANSTLAVAMELFANRDGENNRRNGNKCGPFYAINLLKSVVEEVEIQSNKARLLRMGRMSDDILNAISQTATRLNVTTFEVYTKAMDALHEMMSDQFGVVVQAGVNGTTYSFVPTDLGNISNIQGIIQYLNGLVSNANLSQLMENLLQELITNREEWTKLVDHQDPTAAPKAMRRFWNQQLDKLVSATMEDFLIKYYSGDSDAYYSVETHAQTYPYLQTAAKAIYDQMLGTGGRAQPMAGLVRTGLQPSDFNAHTFLMVPECAPNLFKELQNLAASAPAGLQVDVCTSMATDRISCYKQYTSIPAFKLDWVCVAEQAYERDLPTEAAEGVHMSDTVGGNQWRNFPNLLPRSTWQNVAVDNYSNERENNLANRADTLFDQAAGLALTTSMLTASGTQNLEYSVKVLAPQWRPGDDLFRDLDRCPDGPMKRAKLDAIDQKAQECAMALFKKVSRWESAEDVPGQLNAAGVAFTKNDLFFADSILTVGPGDVRPDDWDAHMAKCMLRKLPDVMDELSGTVMVMEKLMVLVNKAVSARTLITQFAQYLATDMFRYNETTQMWQYSDKNGFPKDLVFIANDIQRVSQYYYMFDAFRNDPETVCDGLAGAFAAKVPVMGDPDQVKKAQAFLASAKAMKEELTAWNQNPPVNPYIAIMKSAGYDVDAIKRFYLALYKEYESMALVGYIPVVVTQPVEEPQTNSSLADSYLF